MKDQSLFMIKFLYLALVNISSYLRTKKIKNFTIKPSNETHHFQSEKKNLLLKNNSHLRVKGQFLCITIHFIQVACLT